MFSHQFLAVPGLNVDALLGLDFIDSLSFEKNTKQMTINNSQVKIVNGISVIDCSDQEISDFQNSRILEFGKIDEFTFKSFGDVTEEQKSKLLQLFRRKELCLARNSRDIGKLFRFRYTLPMFDERETAYLPPRPVPPNLLPKVDEEINKFKNLGIIESSESGFNIPLLILKKSDGTLRVSLDARQLNTKLVPDRFPLPSMTELLSKVSNRLSSENNDCFVSCFDINKAYWQLPIAESDSHKVSFSYRNDHYRSTRMLYGLSTAPAAWSRVMRSIFGDSDKILIYLDDIIIISGSFEEHLSDLEYFLDLCIQNGLTMSMSKIKLCSQEFEFLGHKITRNGIQPTETHIDSINKFQRPRNRQELKRFIGMATFNLKMVKNASITLSPLHQLTSCRKSFIWTDVHQEAFEKIKADLKETTGLAHRNLKYPMYLSTDASLTSAGATLYQKTPSGNFQAIGYFSGMFSKPETRLSSRHREIIALYRGIKHFEFHLIGSHFTAIVDHKSLLYLFREHYRCSLSNKLVNILIYLQNFEFDIIHSPGSSEVMQSADYLSRLDHTSMSEIQSEVRNEEVEKVFMISHLPFTDPKETGKFNEEIVLQFADFESTTEQMIQLQKSCSFCENVRRKLQLSAKKSFKHYELDKNGLLMRKTKAGLKLVLPDSKAFEFVSYVHALYLHPGHRSLSKIISRICFVHDLIGKCKLITRNCLTCVSNKPMSTLKSDIVKPKAYEALPFAKVGIDLYDLGKPDRHNKRYLFTMTDHLTSFVDGIPINSKCDQATSTAFSTLILRHGVCGQVCLDNGKEFAGPLFQDVARKFRLNLHYSSPYNSRANSRCERSHRDILVKQKVLGSNRRNWSTHWPFIQCIINNTPRESLNGLTSAECVYGRPTHYPFAFQKLDDESPKSNHSEALNKYMTHLWPELLNLQLQRYSKLNNTTPNQLPKIEIGDFVLVWKPKLLEGKLSTLWEGPYKVIKHYSNVSYHLINPETGLKLRRHLRHLRPIGEMLNNKLKTQYNDDESDIQSDSKIMEGGVETHTFDEFPFNLH